MLVSALKIEGKEDNVVPSFNDVEMKQYNCSNVQKARFETQECFLAGFLCAGSD